MKLVAASLVTMSVALTAARADTPERCGPLSAQASVTVDGLPAEEREAARSAAALASTIARHRGSTALPVLVRLSESRPGSAHLVAYVSGQDGHLVTLVYYSTALKQSHSLVDARPIVVEGIREPKFQGTRETHGVYFRLYDFGDHEISVSETATDRLIDGRRSGRPGHRAVVIDTGYSFGGPYSCRSAG